MTQNKALLFKAAFQMCWQYRIARYPKEIVDLWSNNRGWTDFMLSEEDVGTHSNLAGEKGFLKDVSERWFANTMQPHLRYRSKNQWYTMDAYAVESDWPNGDYTKTNLHLVIEHENSSDVETEMWKLIHLRAPLKVLVFYNWSEVDRNHGTKNSMKAVWLKNKIAEFDQMLYASVNVHGPDINSQYLLIIGSKTLSDNIVWQYYISDESQKLITA